MATKLNLREFNKRNVYKLIYDSDGISKLDISLKLKLSSQTVAQNLSELKAQNLIKEDGVFDSTGGRKARIIRVSEDVKLAVGLDITRNHVALVVIDLKSNVLKSVRLHYPFKDVQSYYNGLWDILDKFLSESNIDRSKILGVGISLPAIISADGRGFSYLKVLPAPVNLYEKLSRVIPFPFLFFNDANAGGVAEIRFRGPVQKIVYVSLSNSVGGAIIYTDHLSKGDNQRSGEFGHMTLREGGSMCYCGKRGCADAYCNAKILSDITDGDLEEFFRRLRNKDRVCVTEFRKYMKNLALLVYNLRMCFDCDIVLGGYVGSYMGEYIDDLMEAVNDRNPFENNGNYVRCCNFKMEASAVGAALHYVDGFLKNIR